ncbi:unnamed protein product [Gongylonema pulchrum]|uniref:C2H2-type domain-containing protein n=1 Tax=Gongylonema pulchrum TaxID=637853 RepID=A0A183EHT2_9BILA|nr:unnamed protein product [Gongylonema pulchrum]
MRISGSSFTISLFPVILLIFLATQRRTEAARGRKPRGSTTSSPKSQASDLNIREKHDHISSLPILDIYKPPSLASSSSAAASISQLPYSFGTPSLQQRQHYLEGQPWWDPEQFFTFHPKFPNFPGPSSSVSSDSYRSRAQLKKHSVFGDKIDLLYKPPFMVPAAVAEEHAENVENRRTFSAARASTVNLHSAVPPIDNTITEKLSAIIKRRSSRLEKIKPLVFYKHAFAGAESTQAKSKVNRDGELLRVPCPKCPNTFINRHRLLTHIYNKHRDLATKSDSTG